jgi:hypothetical protein
MLDQNDSIQALSIATPLEPTDFASRTGEVALRRLLPKSAKLTERVRPLEPARFRRQGFFGYRGVP